MSETVAKNSQGDKTKPPALLPYDELCWRSLKSALRYAPLSYAPSGWFWLDADGRRKLEDDGLDKADLQAAVNYGVTAGLLTRKVVCGVPCIRLTTKGARR